VPIYFSAEKAPGATVVEKLPQSIQRLSDQRPQYKAIETVAYGTEWGFDGRTTPAYSPERNGIAESVVKLFKRDYVYANEIWTAESCCAVSPNGLMTTIEIIRIRACK
jgi:putative transposase